MKLCIAGKNDVAVSAIEHALTVVPKSEILALPCADDEGRDGWQRSLLQYAHEHGIRVVNLSEVYLLPDLYLVSLEYDRLLDVTRFVSGRLFNVHFSLLPAYRGAYTAVWPILNGESKTGVTLHEIDNGIDTGPVIDQVEFPIANNDRSRDLYFKCMETGAAILRKNLTLLIEGGYQCKPQPAWGASFYSRRSIDFGNLRTDMKKTAFEVHNQVRAYCFPEYQLPIVCGHRISSSEILQSRSTAKPGSLVTDQNEHLVVATIDYDVKLVKASAPP